MLGAMRKRERIQKGMRKPRGEREILKRAKSDKCWQWELVLVRKRDRCIAMGRKDRKKERKKERKREKDKRGWRGGGWQSRSFCCCGLPLSLLAGPLEAFQRALLYLIKASQAPGSAPRPAIFLHFLQTRAGIFKEKEGGGGTELKQQI